MRILTIVLLLTTTLAGAQPLEGEKRDRMLRAVIQACLAENPEAGIPTCLLDLMLLSKADQESRIAAQLDVMRAVAVAQGASAEATKAAAIAGSTAELKVLDDAITTLPDTLSVNGP